MFEIGKKPRSRPVTLVERLLDCHDRIRRISELACQLAEATGRPDAEIREAAARVARYFEEALPRHVADESATIEPRLRGREPDLDRALEAMDAEHGAHQTPVAELVAACRRLESEPAALPELEGLGPLARALRDDFAAHLEAEERVIFPAIDRLIPADQQEVMLAELAARRDK